MALRNKRRASTSSRGRLWPPHHPLERRVMTAVDVQRRPTSVRPSSTSRVPWRPRRWSPPIFSHRPLEVREGTVVLPLQVLDALLHVLHTGLGLLKSLPLEHL